MLQYKKLKLFHKLFIALLVLVGALLFFAPTTTADHGMTVEECEDAYHGASGISDADYRACLDHAGVPMNATTQECEDAYHGPSGLTSDQYQACLTHAEDRLSRRDCNEDEVEIGVAIPGEDNCIGTDENPIFVYLRGILRFLATGVGIAITISIVIGGIQYMSSRGNPQATQAAISRITNAVIALVLFILMAAILNFLVPGGLV